MTSTTSHRVRYRGTASAPRGEVLILGPMAALMTLAVSTALLVVDGSYPWRLVRLALVVGFTVVVAAFWLRPGRTAGWFALIAGVIGSTIGVGLGIRWLIAGGLSWKSLLGTITLLSGLALVMAAIRRLTAERSRLVRGVVGSAVGLLAALLVWTLAPAVIATNLPPIAVSDRSPVDVGLYAEPVRFTTSDDVELFAWFVPPTDGKTVILRHGAGSTSSDVLAHAEVLAGHGYGVLITDARGHGRSRGRAMDFGWFGDVDISAALDFVVEQPGVDPDRIAVVGMSMGGEEAIGAAGSDYRIAAVVAEGATARTDSDKAWLSDVYGWRGWVQRGLEWLQYTVADILTGASKPESLASAASFSSRPIMLVTAGLAPDELNAARYIRGVDADRITIWTVPGAGHTQGLSKAPEAWDENVIGFLDTALTDR